MFVMLMLEQKLLVVTIAGLLNKIMEWTVRLEGEEVSQVLAGGHEHQSEEAADEEKAAAPAEPDLVRTRR
jgi:hypothetical protein